MPRVSVVDGQFRVIGLFTHVSIGLTTRMLSSDLEASQVQNGRSPPGCHMREGVRKCLNPTPYVAFELFKQPCEKASKMLDFSTCGRGGSSPHVSEKERAEGGFQGGFRAQTGAARPHVWGTQKRRKDRELHDKNRLLGRRSLTGERRFETRGMVEAVGIEPTSDGQSLPATTSVACVLSSPRRRPQAGLPRG